MTFRVCRARLQRQFRLTVNWSNYNAVLVRNRLSTTRDYTRILRAEIHKTAGSQGSSEVR